jgi:dihydroflavonol-4-reductase
MPDNWTFTEKNWSDPVGDHIDAYSKSKTMAEKAAWDF